MPPRNNRIVSKAVQTFRDARRVLVIDWPSPDVPDTLVRTDHQVFVKEAPGSRDDSLRELSDGEVVVRPLGEAPQRVDVVYAHRPEGELAGIIATAKQLGARLLWWQSGVSGAGTKDPNGCWTSDEQSQRVRELAVTAGLRYVDDVYIADAARAGVASQ